MCLCTLRALRVWQVCLWMQELQVYYTNAQVLRELLDIPSLKITNNFIEDTCTSGTWGMERMDDGIFIKI